MSFTSKPAPLKQREHDAYVGVRMESQLRGELARAVTECDLSASQIIRRALREYLPHVLAEQGRA